MEKDREYQLSERLVKLADMMEMQVDSDDQRFYKELSREYRDIIKELYPEMVKFSKSQVPTKLRKPSNKFLGTLAKCTCGKSEGWTFHSNNLKKHFSCPTCHKQGEADVNLSKARDNWNNINKPKLK